jgi:hypothetical protein
VHSKTKFLNNEVRKENFLQQKKSCFHLRRKKHLNKKKLFEFQLICTFKEELQDED